MIHEVFSFHFRSSSNMIIWALDRVNCVIWSRESYYYWLDSSELSFTRPSSLIDFGRSLKIIYSHRANDNNRFGLSNGIFYSRWVG